MKHNRTENLGIPHLKTDQGVFVTDKAETWIPIFFPAFTNEQLPLPKISRTPYPSISALQTSPKGVAKQLSHELPTRLLREMSQ